MTLPSVQAEHTFYELSVLHDVCNSGLCVFVKDSTTLRAFVDSGEFTYSGVFLSMLIDSPFGCGWSSTEPNISIS